MTVHCTCTAYLHIDGRRRSEIALSGLPRPLHKAGRVFRTPCHEYLCILMRAYPHIPQALSPSSRPPPHTEIAAQGGPCGPLRDRGLYCLHGKTTVAYSPCCGQCAPPGSPPWIRSSAVSQNLCRSRHSQTYPHRSAGCPPRATSFDNPNSLPCVDYPLFGGVD